MTHQSDNFEDLRLIREQYTADLILVLADVIRTVSNSTDAAITVLRILDESGLLSSEVVR